MNVTFSSLVGERLKEVRKALDLNQAEVAEAVGVTREYWGRCERGASVPGGEVLAALASKGADVLYILTGERSSAQPARDAAEQVLLDSYRRCGAQARQNLIQTAALLAAGIPGGTDGSGRQVNTASGAVQILGSKNRVTNKRN